jgi:ribonuclease HI
LHSQQYPFSAICLQSLGVFKCDLPVLANYYYPPFVSLDKDRKVRTATYVLKSLQASPFQPPVTQFADACEISLVGGQTMKIVNVYFPSGCTKKEHTQWITELENDNWLVVGDFNAHHALWGGCQSSTDTAGDILASHIIDSDLCLLNDGSSTRIPDQNGPRATAIDISIISSNMYASAEWEVYNDTLGSDHFPITTFLYGVDLAIKSDVVEKYDYEKADWQKFVSLLNSADYSLCSDGTATSVEDHYQNLSDIIIDAADKAIPKKRVSQLSKHSPNPWWNDDCEAAVRRKRRAFTRYKRRQSEESYNELKLSRIECKRTIANSKKTHWERYISTNVQSYHDSSIIWKKVKSIKQRYCPVERPLVHDGIKTQTDLEKANLLANVFAKASQSESLSPSQQQYRLREEQKYKEPEPDFSSPLNFKFSFSDLNKCINSIKSVKKATGSDPVSYRLIQHFPSVTLLELLKLYNRCWISGIVPCYWKHATVVPVLKQGKSPTNPNSYRPISLTPHVAKVFERLVKFRLEYHLEKNRIIPKLQSGFKPGRGCTDQVVKITSHIKKTLIRKRTFLAAFFDAKKAYDSVWLGKLLHKLAEVGINGRMYNFCKSILCQRSFKVKAGASLSTNKTVDMGIPQGSAIAPTLFNVMLHDIESISLNNAHISLYADDLTLWSTENFKSLKSLYNQRIIKQRFQYNVNQIVSYMNQNGFDLSAEKTVFMIFSRSKFQKNDYFICINDSKIYPSAQVKYLGVIIDASLTWKNHITHIMSKTNQVWNLLKLLKTIDGANLKKNLVQVVGSLVRSRLSYGQESYFAACSSTLAKLQVCECKFLRFALGIPKSVPQDVVYREVGWLPLYLERKFRVAQYTFRANMVPNDTSDELKLNFDDANDSVNQETRKKTPTLSEKMLSIANYTEELCTKANVSAEEVVPVPVYPFPPWQLEALNISTDLGPFCKKDDSLFLQAIAREKIYEEFGHSFQVFTDGSKLDNDNVGAAFYIPGINVTKQYRLNNGLSVFSAEMFAILKAVSYITDMPNVIPDVVIFSDSKSVLLSLTNPSKNRKGMAMEIHLLVHQLFVRGSRIQFQWIPSHTGISGNEVADQKAKNAANFAQVTNDIGLTTSEVSSKLRRVIQSEWKERYKSIAISRNWLELSIDDQGTFPEFPPSILSMFYSLRGKTYKTQYTPQTCCCGLKLDYDHIFTCHQLLSPMLDVHQLLTRYNLPLNRFTLLRKHPVLGWKLTERFLWKLFHSKLGHLL